MKICSKCKEEKEDSLFGKDSRLKSGLRAQCKCCHKKTSDTWRANNKERCNENRKKYYEVNKKYLNQKAKIRFNNCTLDKKTKKNEYTNKYYHERSEKINLERKIKRKNRTEEQKQEDSEKARIYYQKNKNIIIKRSYENFKNQTAEQKKVKAAITKKWRQNNREKARAWSIVGNAILRGDLQKPNFCSLCGVCNVRIHAHHEDYSLPLSVTWLCHICHKELHTKKNNNNLIGEK